MSIRYLCQLEQWPVIEAALSATGFKVEVPLQKSVSGSAAMVMGCGAAFVLFAQSAGTATLEIEVWGIAHSVANQVLESLPIRLHRQDRPIAAAH